MRFVDEAKIFVKAGSGGNGCVSFRREKFIEFGGPDGGNGGRGGDLIVKSESNLNTLVDFRYQRHYHAKRGGDGSGKNKSGASGDSLTIKVPVGTQIFAEDVLLADLSGPTSEFLLAKGGSGGLGNTNFKSSVMKTPRKATKGQPGESLWVNLKLKLLSDVGLIGMPNSGKSTFLAACTRAKPKIAAYPFSTLTPKLGVANDFVIADIPGLITGASLGVGLGHKFLQHIERCNVMLHLIDSTQEDVVQAYLIIHNELLQYNKALLDKPEIIALNKCDLLSRHDIQQKVMALEHYAGKKIYKISGTKREGIEELLQKVNSIISHKATSNKSQSDQPYVPRGVYS
ncbi:GTPase Obg [Rickettsiales bacterium]|nr:GTPase Obg [Rickettsiales bacterium]